MIDEGSGGRQGRDANSSEPPFGITDSHGRIGGFARWRTPVAVLFFAVVLGSAMLGWLGGGGSRSVHKDTGQASVTVRHEPILRSGNWFETMVIVRPKRDVGDLVISVSDELWRGMSIDTQIPDAESVESTGGRYSFHYGALAANEVFRLKLDGQIQPHALRRLAGDLVVADGEAPLASVQLALTVLP
jgi:hypothetical protein